MLNVKNINQYYGGSHILRNVSFDVPMGKVTTLLGRNGVGKTTLLKTLMGLVPASQGQLLLDGQELNALPPHRRVRAGLGFVPQTENVFATMSIVENLQIAVAHLPRAQRKPAIEAMVAVGAIAMSRELRSPCCFICARSAAQRSGSSGDAPQASGWSSPRAARVSAKDGCGPRSRASSQEAESAWK